MRAATDIVASTSVVGWLRPAILLPPATAMGLTAQQLEAVLAHELAHVRRHDYAVNLLQVGVGTPDVAGAGVETERARSAE